MDPDQNPVDNTPPVDETPPVDNTPPEPSEDDTEWEQAGLDFLADNGIDKEKESDDEPTKPEEGVQKTGEGEEGPEGQEPGAKPPEGQDGNQDPEAKSDPASKDEGQQAPPPQVDPAAEERARRRAQLDLEADRRELAKDIREKMFSDVPNKLLDSEGQEIRTPQDVTQYKNPVTGENFTLEEASQWLMAAQRSMEQKYTESQEKVEAIVEVGLTIKSEADTVMAEYGDFLANNPGLRKQLWMDYSKTLTIDDSGDVITAAPVSMKNFYDTVLAPHVQHAKQVAQQQAEAEKQSLQEKAKAEALDKAKAEVKAKKKEVQSDREDVISARTKSQEDMDPDEKEWASAAKDYYES